MTLIDPQIFGSRLKHARKLAGVSLQGLSDLLENKVTKQSLNKYEQGIMKPATDILFRIAKALSVKPEYLIKQSTLELGEISFRKRAALAKSIEESIVEKARDYVERYLELEDLLGIQASFTNPLEEFPILNKDDVKYAAERLRLEWELGNGAISNLIEMLEMQGIKVQLVEESDHFDGFAAFSKNNIPIVVINTSGRFIERVRFTIIHELAHLLLTLSDDILKENKLVEEYCHYFSSCFLLPEKALTQRIGNNRTYITISELIQLKEQFGISIKAIVHRLRTIGVITNTYYQKWMVYMSKTYGSKNEPGAYKGEEKKVQMNMLVNRALSEEIISFSKAASLANCSIEEIRKRYHSVE